MPAFLRPPHPHRLQHYFGSPFTGTHSNEVLEVLAQSGAIDPSNLMDKVETVSGRPYFELMERLVRPTPEELAAPLFFGFLDFDRARTGEAFEGAPRADERVALWAMEETPPSAEAQAALLEWAVSRRMPWVVTSLVNALYAAPTINAKSFADVFAAAIDQDEPALIVPLARYAKSQGWEQRLDWAISDPLTTEGTHALISVRLEGLSEQEQADQWTGWTHAWFNQPFQKARTTKQAAYSDKHKKAQEEKAATGRFMAKWALKTLAPKQHDPLYQTAIFWALANQVLYAEKQDREHALQAYANHWADTGQPPDNAVTLSLPALMTGVFQPEHSPGRAAWRAHTLSKILDERDVQSKTERRLTQAMLWLSENTSLNRVTDPYHHERFQERSAALNFTTREVLDAIQAYARSMTNVRRWWDPKMAPGNPLDLLDQTMTWVISTPDLTIQEQHEALLSVQTLSVAMDERVHIKQDHDLLSTSRWLDWLKRVEEAAQTTPEARLLFEPLLALANRLANTTSRPEKLLHLLHTPLGEQEPTRRFQAGLIQTLVSLLRSGASYQASMDADHCLQPLHDTFREISLDATLPVAQPKRKGPRF